MFPTTSSVDERLADAVAEVEAADPALRVVAARVFRLPYARLRARAALQNPRRFNILEEFVLRAAAELAPAPNAAELAALLGLDPLFIDATLSQLEALKAVTRGRAGAVSLTPQGRQFRKEGQALQPADHKVLSLLYRAGLDDLQLWAAPPDAPDQAPILPGLAQGARQGLGAAAQAAVTPEAVIAASVAGGLGLHEPSEGRVLTGVDQVAVDDLGSLGCGVLVVQSLATGQASLRAIDLDSQAVWPELQARLDEGRKAGRVKLADFLPPPSAVEVDLGADDPAPEPPEYLKHFQAQLAAGGATTGVELLAGGSELVRAAQFAQAIEQALLLFVPRLTPDTMRPGVLSALDALAGRGVVTIIGWGVADDRKDEKAEPAPDVLDTLAQLRTPEGLPAAVVWWVGGLYGQDAVGDHNLLASSLPNLLSDQGASASAGVATYVVTAADLVSAALDELEPSLARAARQGWQSSSRTPEAGRQVLVAACQTWVAIRRPGEALSHLLKLAASLAEETPGAMLVAWEAFTAICISLSPQAADDLAAMDAPDALRRAIPEFLDWADSALPPTGETQPPFVAAFHDLLVRYSQLDADDLPKLLAETRQLWAEVGKPSGAAGLTHAFAGPAPAEPKLEKPKKRRY